MKLDRTLAIFDLETTGLDPAVDRIVSFGVRIYTPGVEEPRLYQTLVNPTIPIPAEATRTHGITDEMVAQAPRFAEIADYVLYGAFGFYRPGAYDLPHDLGGYNILNYDIPLLWEEFHRSGYEWDPAVHRVVDALAIWRAMEPRNLQQALKFFRPDVAPPDQFHGVGVDTWATDHVIRGQLERYPGALRDVGRAAEFTADQTRRVTTIDGEEMPFVDLAGALALRADGEVILTHKKVRGRRVMDERKYAGWMLQQDFSANTKMHLRAAMGLQPKPNFEVKGGSIEDAQTARI